MTCGNATWYSTLWILHLKILWFQIASLFYARKLQFDKVYFLLEWRNILLKILLLLVIYGSLSLCPNWCQRAPLCSLTYISAIGPLLYLAPLSQSLTYTVYCCLFSVVPTTQAQLGKDAKVAAKNGSSLPDRRLALAASLSFELIAWMLFLTFRIHIVSRIYVWDGDRWSKKIWIGGGALLHSVFWLITIVNRLLNVSEHPC